MPIDFDAVRRPESDSQQAPAPSMGGGINFDAVFDTDTSQPGGPERGLGGVVSDSWNSFAGGANALLKTAGDLYGLTTGDMDNWASNQGERGREYWNSRKTDYLKALESQRQERIEAADGLVGKAGVAFWDTITSPSLLTSFIFEQAPMLLPGMGVGRGAGLAAKAAGATEKVAGRVGTWSAVGAGGAMQGSDAGSSAYEQLMQLSDDVWMQNPAVARQVNDGRDLGAVKREMATKLSRNAAVSSFVASVGLNMVPGARTLEKALSGAKIPQGRISGALTGFLGESVSEGLEEGSGQYLANWATGEVDPGQDLWEGVGEATGLGATAGIFGGVAGAAASREIGPFDDETRNAVNRIAESESVDDVIKEGMDFIDTEIDAQWGQNPVFVSLEDDLQDMGMPAPEEIDAAYLERESQLESQQQSLRDQDFDKALDQKADQDLELAQYAPGSDTENTAMRDAMLAAYIRKDANERDAVEAEQALEATRAAAAKEEDIQRQFEGMTEREIEEFRKRQPSDTYGVVERAARLYGGINKQDAKEQGLFDVVGNNQKGIHWVFTNNGMTVDQLSERLFEDGYFPDQDNYSANDVVSMIDDELRGLKIHYTPAGQEFAALLERREEELLAEDMGDEQGSIFDDEYYEPESTPDESYISELGYYALLEGVSPDTLGQLGGMYENDHIMLARAIEREIENARDTAPWATSQKEQVVKRGLELTSSERQDRLNAENEAILEERENWIKENVSPALYEDLSTAVAKPELSLSQQTESDIQEQERQRKEAEPKTEKPTDDPGDFQLTKPGMNQEQAELESRGQTNLLDSPNPAQEEGGLLPEPEPEASPEPEQTPEKTAASEQPEVDEKAVESEKELDPILTRSRGAHIRRMVREAGIKKGSPGFDNAKAQIEEQYENDLDDALANADFDTFKSFNEGIPDAINLQAYNQLREERGLDPVAEDKLPPGESKNQSSPEEIEAAANEAATSPENNLPEPTEAQKEAGNYKKGKIKLHGLDISIENPKGSERSGTDPDGNEWSVTMQHHYGDIKRTVGAEGNVGEGVDVFIGDNPDSEKVFVIDQVNADGSFDEHKIMLAFDTQEEAVAGYKSNYEDGWTVGPVSFASIEEFKTWLNEGDTTKPYSGEMPAPAKAESKPDQKTKSSARVKKNQSSGMTRRAVIEAIAEPLEKLKSSGEGIYVVQDVTGLPKSVQRRFKREIDQGLTGAFVGEDIYLIADNIANAREARVTLAHELIGHKGVYGIFSEEDWQSLDKLVDSLIESGDKQATRLWNRVSRDYKGNTREVLVSEFIAAVAEERALRTGLKNAWAFVREMLRRGLKAIGLNRFANSELDIILRNSEKYIKRGAKTDNKESGASVSEPSDQPVTETPAFKAWVGSDAEVIEPHEVGDFDFSQPGPFVMRAFHGSTHQFDSFDASIRGNKEGQFGAVNYFSTSESDASYNYGDSGPDLTNMIARTAEWASQDLAFDQDSTGVVQWVKNNKDLDIDAIQEMEREDRDKLAEEYAREKHVGGDPDVYEVFVRTEKPFVIGSGSPWLEFVDYEVLEESAIIRVAEGEGLEVSEVEENRDDYEDQIDEARWEIESEEENELVEAIQLVADRYELDASEILSDLVEVMHEGISHSSFEEILRSNEQLSYAEDPSDGGLIGYHVLAEIIQELGFDSIILKDADNRFSSMNIDSGTAHIHVFDENNTNIKSVDNSGTFNRSNPNIYLRKKPSEPSEFEDDAAGFAVPEDTLTSVAIRKMQDKFKFLKDVQAEIKKAGGKVTEENDAYLAEELFHGMAENDIRLFREQFVEPLANKMADFGITHTELDQYLYAMHAKERNERIAEINPKMPDGGSGMKTSEANAIKKTVRESGKQGEYDQLAQIVYDMLKEKRDLIREKGLEDDGLIDAWEDRYKYYVPLKGWEDDTQDTGGPGRGQGFNVGGKESQAALGRSSKSASPLSYAINDVTKALIRGRKNEVGNSLLKLIQDNPNPDFWEVFTDENPEKEQKLVDGKEVKDVALPMGMMQDRYFRTKKDGKTYYMHLKDERLMTAMKNLGPETNGALIRSLGAVNRLLSALNTSYSPEFMVSNFARDIQTAVLNLQSEQSHEEGKAYGKKIAAKTLKDVPIAMRAVYRSLQGKELKGASAEWGKYFDEFRTDGAKTGWFDMKDLEGQEKELESLVQMASGGAKGAALKFMRSSATLVENMNQSVENAVRLSAYVNARKSGISRRKAASLAKNMTVNFNRKGEMGVLLNSLYMFANASIQGVANFARTMGTLKGDKKLRWQNLNNAQRIAIGIAGGAYFLGQANRMAAGDDDDGENWYDKVPDYVKERNLVIMKSMFGGEQNGEYWKIPLPYGYNVFFVLGSGMESVMNGNKSAAEAGSSMLLATLGSFSPIGFQDSETVSGLLLKNAAPTIFKPVVEIGLNENFMGSSIYNENFPFGTPKPASSMGRRSTPEGYKKVTEWLNEVTGGSEYRSGSVDVNPDIMQYLVGYFGGSAYSFFGDKLPDYGYRKAVGVDVEQYRTPFLSRITGKVLPYEDMDKFYQRRDEIAQVEEEYDALRGSERVIFRREYRGELNLRREVSIAERRLRTARKRRDRIYGADLSAAERDSQLAEVEKDMKAIVDRFNRAYGEAQK